MHKIHKYQRVPYGQKKTIIYRCILPNCSHYLLPELVKGRESVCWKCDKPFVITPLHMIAKPTCCTNKKFKNKGLENQEYKESLDSIFEMLSGIKDTETKETE